MSNIPNKQHNFEIGYTPFNFFYSTNRQDFPKGIGGCSILEEEQKIGQLKCDDDSSIDKCYQLELCKNKDLVIFILNFNSALNPVKKDKEGKKDKNRFPAH